MWAWLTENSKEAVAALAISVLGYLWRTVRRRRKLKRMRRLATLDSTRPTVPVPRNDDFE